jgi:hypothetical protein
VPLSSFKKKENIHFDREEDFHMSSQNNEENGYGLDLDFVIIWY